MLGSKGSDLKGISSSAIQLLPSTLVAVSQMVFHSIWKELTLVYSASWRAALRLVSKR